MVASSPPFLVILTSQCWSQGAHYCLIVLLYDKMLT